MGYYVLRNKQTWRLVWAEGKKTPARSVPKDSAEAAALGFRREMGIEEARAHARRMQAEDRVRRENARTSRAHARLAQSGLRRSAFLTDDDAAAFELKMAQHRILPPHWNTMQKIIVGCGTHPSDWFDEPQPVYEQFIKLRISASYAVKLTRFLNLWGRFVCKRHGRVWDRINAPRGPWRARLEAARRPGGHAMPLSPQLLEEKRDELPAEAYRWLYLSVWFGLRPREVDQLRANEGPYWYVMEDPAAGTVLAVFQHKLAERSVDEEHCWKYIPIVFPEQRAALDVIRGRDFARPCGAGGKIMRRVFGARFSLYAGRNNFAGMLRERGYSLECRRSWLGHMSVKTTEAYERKFQRKVVFSPPSPPPKKKRAA